MNLTAVLVAILAATSAPGSASKESESPNADVMWSLQSATPDKIPISIAIPGKDTPADTPLLEKAYSLIAGRAAKAGLTDLLSAVSGGQDAPPPADSSPTSDNPASDEDKKAAGREVAALALLSGDLGMAALEKGDLNTSAKALDLALAVMTSFRGDESRMKKAMSLWGTESIKDFKGEPHERSSVFMWRGFSYIAAGDIENARACFISANLQDEFANDPKSRGNWLVADLFERQCSVWLGDGLESQITERMQKNYSDLKIPTASKRQNVAIVFAMGYAPVKQAGGYQGSQLAYQRAETGAAWGAILPPGQPSPRPLENSDDIVLQAVTRGLRSMDQRLAEEAKTKDDVKMAGDALVQVGGYVPLPYVGDIMRLLGRGVRAAGSGIKVFADTRGLLSVPSSLAVVFVNRDEMPPGTKIAILDREFNTIAQTEVPVMNGLDKPTVLLVRYVGQANSTRLVLDPYGPTTESKEKPVDKNKASERATKKE